MTASDEEAAGGPVRDLTCEWEGERLLHGLVGLILDLVLLVTCERGPGGRGLAPVRKHEKVHFPLTD